MFYSQVKARKVFFINIFYSHSEDVSYKYIWAVLTWLLSIKFTIKLEFPTLVLPTVILYQFWKYVFYLFFKKISCFYDLWTKRIDLLFLLTVLRATSFRQSIISTRYFFTIISRAYSGPLLGATIAANLMPWFFKRIFSLEMVKNDICLGGAIKQNAFFFRKYPPKKRSNAPNV